MFQSTVQRTIHNSVSDIYVKLKRCVRFNHNPLSVWKLDL